MPFQIVNQDITRISCDAIVNPTDHHFSGGGGTDKAIHHAAGSELRKECDTLGLLNKSEIAVTQGYNLPCKYVFHTMGPIWTGGKRNEEALLRACYINALFKAAEMGLHSIAFPLISSGTFGFPKDKVLRIALTAINNFLNLLDTDMDVTICIYNPNAYEISLGEELEAFLHRQTTIAPKLCAPIKGSTRPAPKCGHFEAAPSKISELSPRRAASTRDNWDEWSCAEECPEIQAAPAAMPDNGFDSLKAAPSLDLDGWLKQQDDSFAVTLLKLIDKKHMTDVQCYKKANVSKKTFWKINNDKKYKPSKQTVIAFAIALELNLEETEALLKTVGFSLSHSNTFDMIIEFYIQHKMYDIYEINSALYKFDQVCLGC